MHGNNLKEEKTMDALGLWTGRVGWVEVKFFNQIVLDGLEKFKPQRPTNLCNQWVEWKYRQFQLSRLNGLTKHICIDRIFFNWAVK